MFKMLCVFATFLSVFSAENGLRGSEATTFNVDEVEVWSQFTNFQERFSKKYGSISELEERFQIVANLGKYYIRYELLPGTQASIQLLNWRVTAGPGRIDSSGLLEIYE